MILVVDNYDSFTFTLVDYLKTLGADVRVIRNDEMGVGEVLDTGPDGILVSPGPGTPDDAGISVGLARAAVDLRIPYCGVCLGHQALAVACGGNVDRVGPVHGKIASVRHDGSGLFADLPSPFAATRYHSLAVTAAFPPLIANAWTEEGLIMAMRHVDAPAHGVQFHPESIASEHGHALLGSFLALTQRVKA